MCGCGEPIHYTDESARRIVEALIEKHGPTVVIGVEGSRKAFAVPRHYVGLHGLKAAELPELAARYGWKEAT